VETDAIASGNESDGLFADRSMRGEGAIGDGLGQISWKARGIRAVVVVVGYGLAIDRVCVRSAIEVAPARAMVEPCLSGLGCVARGN
jgi:hypothetical protein